MPSHPMRRFAPTGAHPPATEIRLITNLQDVPADLIGLIDRDRWTIETLFRFFQQTLGCGHLCGDHPQGIRLQAYYAMMACLLIQQSPGRKPTKGMFEMISFDPMGLADRDELQDSLVKEAAKTVSNTTSPESAAPPWSWSRG